MNWKKVMVSLVAFLLIFQIGMAFLFESTEEVEGFKRGHHNTFMEKALMTLNKDGHEEIYHWIRDMEVKEELILGSRQADLLGNNKDHYYNPHTGEGLEGQKTALEVYRNKIRSANNNLLEGNFKDAAHDLGWACHMLQDMGSPHHTHNEPLDGHLDAEDFFQDHSELNSTTSGGFYWFDKHDYYNGWGGRIDWMANYSYDYYDMVNSTANETEMKEAWADLNPRIIRMTASFLYDFFSNMRSYAVSLSETQVTEDSISITWARDYSENFSHYEIYVAKNESGLRNQEYVQTYEIDDIGYNEYTLSGLDTLETYYIKVHTKRDINNSTETLKSNTLEVNTKWPYSTLITLGILISALVFAVTTYIRYKNYDRKAMKFVRKRR